MIFFAPTVSDRASLLGLKELVASPTITYYLEDLAGCEEKPIYLT
jgi:hypothetical protein